MMQIASVHNRFIGHTVPRRAEASSDGKLDVGSVLFATCVSSSILFVSQISSLTVVVGICAFFAYLIYRPRFVVTSIANNWLLMAFMALIFLSTFWSKYPGTTVYYGMEAGLTLLIALQFGRQSRHDEGLIGLFMGWSVYTLGSLMFGHSVKWGSHGGTAFSGLVEGKNYAGDTAVLGFIFAIHVMKWGLSRRRMAVAAYAVLVAVADLGIIYMAQSSGAVLGIVEVLLIFSVLSLFEALSLAIRSSVMIATSFFVAILSLTSFVWMDFLRNGVLNFFEKDPTLTGRFYLWARAEGIMQTNPWLGIGYNAFWVQGDLDAEGLWRYEGIINRSGFNFHNSAIEMRVQLGWIGLIAGAVVLGLYSLRLLKNFTLHPTAARMTWIMVLVYELARMPYEAIGISPFSYATTVVVGALAAGARVSVRQY